MRSGNGGAMPAHSRIGHFQCTIASRDIDPRALTHQPCHAPRFKASNQTAGPALLLRLPVPSRLRLRLSPSRQGCPSRLPVPSRHVVKVARQGCLSPLVIPSRHPLVIPSRQTGDRLCQEVTCDDILGGNMAERGRTQASQLVDSQKEAPCKPLVCKAFQKMVTGLA